MNQPKREKAKRTKLKIIDAAREIMNNKGVLKTSVNDIVRQAGVAKGTFYLYFEAKEDIINAIIEANIVHFKTLFRSLKDMPVSPEAVEGMIDQLIRALKEHTDILKSMHHVRFLSELNVGLIKNSLADEFADYIKPWLDRGVSQKMIVISDTRFFALYIFSSFHEMIDMTVFKPDLCRIDQLGRNMNEIMHRLLFHKEK